jgi:hypothetical protein
MPSDFLVYMQSGAIAVTLVCVLLTAYFNQRIARRRATLDVIMTEETNPGLLDIRHKFLEIKSAGNIVQYAEDTNKSLPEAIVIRNMLNRYEIIAIGIKNNTLDKKFYKSWFRAAFVRDCKDLKTYINSLQREHNPKAYCAFCELAKEWATPDEKHLL